MLASAGGAGPYTMLAPSILCVALAGFLIFGVWSVAAPASIGALIDWNVAASPTAAVELQAMYGGLELGLAALIGWCLVDRKRHRTGLVVVACTFGGLGLTRTAATLATGGVRDFHYWGIGLELFALAAALVALRRMPRET